MTIYCLVWFKSCSSKYFVIFMAFLDQTDAMVQRYPTVTLKIFQAKVEHKYFQKHNDTSPSTFVLWLCNFFFFMWCHIIYYFLSLYVLHVSAVKNYIKVIQDAKFTSLKRRKGNTHVTLVMNENQISSLAKSRLFLFGFFLPLQQSNFTISKKK